MKKIQGAELLRWKRLRSPSAGAQPPLPPSSSESHDSQVHTIHQSQRVLYVRADCLCFVTHVNKRL